MRRIVTLAVMVAVLAALGAALGAPGAEAHALMVSSDPRDGAQLDVAPETVTIGFTEEPELSLSSIQVLDAAGSTYEIGSPSKAAGDDRSLEVPVGSLPEGAYTVTWRVVSKVDGHATAGSFGFGVGVPADPAAGAATEVDTPDPSFLEMGGRGMFFVGLVGLLGVASVGATGFPRLLRSHHRLLLVSWTSGVAGLVALAVAQDRAAPGGFDALLDTSLGEALIWRGVALGGAGLAIAGALFAPTRWRHPFAAAAGAAAAAAALAHVSTGHAAAASSFGFDVASQWVHVLAVGVWIGGLAVLLLGLRALTGVQRAVAVRRFSLAAAIALVAVVTTGTVRAVSELDAWGDLISSGYGRGVLIKGGLLMVLVALGAVNRYRHVPAASGSVSGLKRVGRAELAVAAVAVGAAAVIASLAPPQPSVAAEDRLVVSGSDFGTTIQAELVVAPGTPGANQFALRLTDYDSDDPVIGAEVTLRFTFLDDTGVGESELVLEEESAGSYRGEGRSLSLDGAWRVIAIVERGIDSVEIPLELRTRSTPQRVEEIRTPGQPTIYDVELPSGRTLQVFLDPQRPGTSSLHATFFDDGGNELPVDSVDVTARPPTGDAPDIELVPFSPGHVIGELELVPGEWTFEIRARSEDGDPLTSSLTIPVAR